MLDLKSHVLIKLFIIFVLFIQPNKNLFAQQTKTKAEIDISTGWKFSPGDDLQWAKPDFDDSRWTPILCNHVWETQGFENHDGFAWYRLEVVFPIKFKKEAMDKGLELTIGKVNDVDQTFLNGHLVGQNGKLLPAHTKITTNFIQEKTSLKENRKYTLQAEDGRIFWGRKNVIAIRVFDRGNNGGLYGSRPHIRALDLSDVIKISAHQLDFQMLENHGYFKSIIVQNTSPNSTFAGVIKINVISSETQFTAFKTAQHLLLKPGQMDTLDYSFISSFYKPFIAYYEFSISSIENVTVMEHVPYLQTPKPTKSPKINGPKIYGVRPGSPFLYRIPATGQRPMSFTIIDLPDGLALESTTGIITGKIKKSGEYIATLQAINQYGKDERLFKIVVGKTLALTPPMGWNSWYIHYDRITDTLMRQAADEMVNSGMADYGYQYVNIDDCWMVKTNSEDPIIGGPPRDENGILLPNKRFPDMNAMTDYIHSIGLKAGLYISPGPRTCAGYTGSYEHENLDAETFAKWGFDFLKYDWCSYSKVARGQTRGDFINPYRKMWNELQNLDRDIVLNLCQYGMGNVWEWGGQYGNCWRTTGDLGLEDNSNMPGFYNIGLSNAQHWKYARPGAWNDPDYILIGWVGNAYKMGVGEKTKLTPDEQYFYMAMWSLMTAPLIFSGDMNKLDPFTLNVLCNNEVINVNQDPLGQQAKIVRSNKNELVLAKDLEDGSKAVGLFNLKNESAIMSITSEELNISALGQVRNLWQQKDLGEFEAQFVGKVSAHGVLLLKIEDAKIN
jgi:alpha-galactosidase